jgi:farnesyl diphosphate synthase
MSPPPRIEAWLADSHLWADAELDRLLPAADEPTGRLEEAMRYAVFGGGKRLRPALVRLIAAHHGASDAACASAAAAIECVHTYSLVHDDLPCMDDDDLRRGRATVHVAFGEALAVLVGDALLTHAFGLLARAGEHAGDLALCLATAAGSSGMVAGQALDLDAQADESGVPAAATRAGVERVHGLKTAALFGAACEMGAIVAGAGARERGASTRESGASTRERGGSTRARDAARAYGVALGHCFQAIDDILDVTGDAATLGKTPGKDARSAKPTLVAALGLDGARAEARRLAEVARAAAVALGPGRGHADGLAAELVQHLLARRA